VAHVLQEMADLDDGGEGAALMSAEGFKAYADDCIWVSAGLGHNKAARAPVRALFCDYSCHGSLHKAFTL
jgi:hypothetical protein